MSRLSQMLAHELKRRERSEPDIAREFGWSQQAFNKWKNGSIPRAQFHDRLADFLRLSPEMLEELIEEAKISTGNTKLPDLGNPIKGRGTPDAITMDEFAMGYAKPQTQGCYAVRVDGLLMWVNPRITPAPGNTVLIIKDGSGQLEKWPAKVDGEAHVVVLAEMA
jgi:transcriptional regulator with XRE-family HTH domain